MAVSIGGIFCINPVSVKDSFDKINLPTDLFWLYANSMQYGINNEEDRGYFLVSASDVESILSDGSSTVDVTAVFTDGTRTLTLSKLVVLSATQIMGKDFGGDAVCLLEVRSQKYILRNTIVGKNYNLLRDVPYPPVSQTDGFLYEKDSLDDGSVWTWESLLEDVLGYAPTNGDTLPNYNPENVQAANCSVAELLDVVARETGIPYYIDESGEVAFGNHTTFLESGLTTELGYPEYKVFNRGSQPYPPGIKVTFPHTEYHCNATACGSNNDEGDMDCESSIIDPLEKGTITWASFDIIYPHATSKIQPTGAIYNTSNLDDLADELWENIENLTISNDDIIYPGHPGTHGLGMDIHRITYRDYGLGPQTVAERFAASDKFLLTNYDPATDFPVHHAYEPKESAVFETPTDGIPAESAALATRKTYDPEACEWKEQDELETLHNPFDEDFPGETLVNAVRTDGTWHLVKSGSGGDTLQGTIESLRVADSEYGEGEDAPYTGLTIAEVRVVVAPCNRSSLIDELVDVVDHSGCVFDLPEDELDGIWAWASEGIAESLDPAAEEGELTPCHWVADDRCCVPGEGAT